MGIHKEFVDRIVAVFDGGGSALPLNKQTYGMNVPKGCTINTWTVLCDRNVGVSGIVITPYKDAHSDDAIPTTTMCTSGTAPNVPAGSHKSKQAAWDCNIATLADNDDIAFKVTTAPTAATWCSLTLKCTR